MSVVRILRGEPDDVELAALVAVLGVAHPPAQILPFRRRAWRDPALALPAHPRPGHTPWHRAA